jgi:GNAT superfamily N-acetyltransferase
MEIHVHSWKDVNEETLAQFSFQARQQDNLITEPPAIDTLRNAIVWWKNRDHSVPIIAYADGEIIGWLVFFSFVPTTATIGRWHPIAQPGSTQKEISFHLLKTAITYAEEKKFERFEAELTGITAKNEAVFESYKELYESHGMCIATEELRVECDLTKPSLVEPVFPPGFHLRPLGQCTNAELEAPFFEMFNQSKDRFWLTQTMKQRKVTFQYWFDRDRPFVEEATTVLIKREEIVGLTVVRLIQEIGMLGPIAVSPQYRRKGLGRALMAYSFQGALKSGVTKMQLEFDITNEPAHKLYNELGFTPVHRLVLFTLPL